jgi:pyridoxal phosphate enzyme (YggS family)
MQGADARRAIEIGENLVSVRERMAAAAQAAGRQTDEVQLVAVSKTHPLAAIEAAYAAGQRDFGENRLEELWAKVEEAGARGLDDIRWHFIGTIQSRKTRQAVGPFTLIHSVDRTKIANRLSRDASEAGYVMEVLLEVNVSGEASKHGFTPESVVEEFADLLALSGIRISGLMTMAPYVDDETVLRNVFRALRRVRDELNAAVPTAGLRHLSMGMTNDFELAIEEGATLVRIGSAIFGERDYGQ